MKLVAAFFAGVSECVRGESTRLAVLVLAATALVPAPVMAEASWFRGLGTPPGDPRPAFYPTAISSDGSVVVGYAEFAPVNRALKWTESGGFEDLGNLGGDPVDSYALGLSADGRVVVGGSATPLTEPGRSEAMRWTEATGMLSLDDLPGGPVDAAARAASADGSVIVGQSSSAQAPNSFGEAFRWTAETGMVPMGILASGDFVHSLALGVSADGSVIVGATRTENGNEAFRWTEAEGMVPLGDVPGSAIPNSWAIGVSAAGSVIVGISNLGDPICFRWTQATGMAELPMLPDGRSCQVFGVSPDGSLIAGSVNGLDSIRSATVWDGTLQPRALADWIAAAGLGAEIEGWRLEGAAAIASDSRTIVGWGRNPEGLQEGFLVHFGEPDTVIVPTLSSVALGAFAALLAALAIRILGRGPKRGGDSTT